MLLESASCSSWKVVCSLTFTPALSQMSFRRNPLVDLGRIDGCILESLALLKKKDFLLFVSMILLPRNLFREIVLRVATAPGLLLSPYVLSISSFFSRQGGLSDGGIFLISPSKTTGWKVTFKLPSGRGTTSSPSMMPCT
jgi:hypothetical protein